MAIQEHRKGEKLSGWKQFILGKRFYFPLSVGRNAAELWANALIAEAKRIKSKGGNEWTPESEARAKAFALGEEAPVAKPAQGRVAPAPKSNETIYADIEKFVSEQETRISTNEIGEDQYHSIKSRLDIIKAWKKPNGLPVIPTIPLDEFGRDEVKMRHLSVRHERQCSVSAAIQSGAGRIEHQTGYPQYR